MAVFQPWMVPGVNRGSGRARARRLPHRRCGGGRDASLARAAGELIRSIARRLGRSPSTISRGWRTTPIVAATPARRWRTRCPTPPSAIPVAKTVRWGHDVVDEPWSNPPRCAHGRVWRGVGGVATNGGPRGRSPVSSVHRGGARGTRSFAVGRTHGRARRASSVDPKRRPTAIVAAARLPLRDSRPRP